MDITSIYAILSPLLKPYIGKGLEEFSGEAGKSLWAAIKKPFTSESQCAVIAQAESNPAVAANQEQLLDLIRNELQNSPVYRESLRQISQTISGDTNVQIIQHGDKSVAIKDNFGNFSIN